MRNSLDVSWPLYENPAIVASVHTAVDALASCAADINAFVRRRSLPRGESSSRLDQPVARTASIASMAVRFSSDERSPGSAPR